MQIAKCNHNSFDQNFFRWSLAVTVDVFIPDWMPCIVPSSENIPKNHMQNIICFALQPNLYCKFCHPKKAWLYWWLAVKWNARVFPFFEFLNKLDPETDVTKALNSFSLIWLSVLNCLCAEVVHSQVLTQMEQLGKRNFHWVFWLLDSSDQGIESEKVIGFGRLAWKPVFLSAVWFSCELIISTF